MIIKRLFLIFVSGLLILTTAQSCNIPGLNLFQNNNNNLNYGILKTDPEVIADGYGFINAVKSGDEISDDGLKDFKTTKFLPYDSDKLFALTVDKGLFVSENAGRYWERKYAYKIDTESQDTINESIKRNDDLFIKDFAIRDQKTYYVAGIDSDNKGKIFKSDDEGDNFRQVYSELDEDVSVELISIDPQNTNTIYAVLSQGALIRSTDAGNNWSKIYIFDEVPTQMEFVPQLNDLFYALLPSKGLLTSQNKGFEWETTELTKNSSEIGENQPIEGFNINPLRDQDLFGNITKIVPVLNDTRQVENGQFPALLIADKQSWYSPNIYEDRSFSKIPLPVQNEKNEIYDIQYHPTKGVRELFVAVNNQILTSQDAGVSWNVDDNLNLDSDTELGPIFSINFDPNNPEIRYLTISEPYNQPSTSFFG